MHTSKESKYAHVHTLSARTHAYTDKEMCRRLLQVWRRAYRLRVGSSSPSRACYRPRSKKVREHLPLEVYSVGRQIAQPPKTRKEGTKVLGEGEVSREIDPRTYFSGDKKKRIRRIREEDGNAA